MPELLAQHMKVSLDARSVSEPLRRAYTLAQSGHHQEALDCLTEELLRDIQEMEPGSETQVASGFVLAETWRSLERVDRAIAAYESIRRVRLDLRVYHELIQLYRKVAQYSRAFDCAQEALTHWPDYLEIKVLYGKCLFSLGRLDEGLRWMEGLIDAGEITPEGHLDYVWYLNYRLGIDRQTLLSAQQGWVKRYAPASLAWSHHENVREPDRRLKIGYLSCDFRTHSVVYTFEPLLDGRNPDDFEVFGYGHVQEPDETTQRLQGKFDHYRDLRGLTPEAMAQTIRRDGIDILVGLVTAAHTLSMQVMAYKPAPIQMDIGSLCTTAMPQIDYLLVDAVLNPPEAQTYYTERFVHLPSGFFPYRPPAQAPDVNPLPAQTCGQVTFGTFAFHLKINREVIAVWSAILHQTPRSRLLIKTSGGHDQQVVDSLLETFAAHGVDPQRVKILGWLPRSDHWALYHQVDLALDTFPFQGCLTTLEALWMGVPTVTVRGDVLVSRIGEMILSYVGLTSLVARDTRQMIAKAVALAQDWPLLAKLRASLRQAVQRSPLCDSVRSTQETEMAYRSMWRQWCQRDELRSHTPLTLETLPQALVQAQQIIEVPDLHRFINEIETLIESGQLVPGSEGYLSSMVVTGSLCRRLGQLEQAALAYERLRDQQPNQAVYYELISVYRNLKRYGLALERAQEAMRRWPQCPELQMHQAECLISLGQWDEGLSQLRALIDSGRASSEIHLQALWYLSYQKDIQRADLLAAHRNWAQRHIPLSGQGCEPAAMIRDKSRLRIGYLSSDFHTHSVSYTFEPLLDGRDRERFEVIGYGRVVYPDETTRRLQQKFDHYRDVQGCTPEAIAAQIRADQIDILVTLAGHCSDVALHVMALRPAPIQVDIGSICSTGMDQIDYRVTDPIQDPPQSQAYYTEKLLYVPGGFVPYGPPAEAPAVGQLPASIHGHVTFGSFANHLKINNDVIAVWSEILKQTPGSRMLLKSPGAHDAGVNEMMMQAFEAEGIERHRIEMMGWLPRQEHWALYNQVDISLDTFPYNGGVTTLEALWMGVPTVTVAGETFVARTGEAILKQVGLSSMVAASPEQMVAKAVALAMNLSHLARLRTHLRSAVCASGLCDDRRLAAGLEEAYRRMWQEKGDQVNTP